MYQIKSGMHGPTDISPVGLAAALHLGIAIHNFGIQEYMKHSPVTDELFQPAYTFADGLLHPGRRARPGSRPTSTRSRPRHPYDPAYLPVNRLLDGSDARLVRSVG